MGSAKPVNDMPIRKQASDSGPAQMHNFCRKGSILQSWWHRVHRSESLCSVGGTTHISVPWVASTSPASLSQS